MLQAHLFRLRGTNVISNVGNSGSTIVTASRMHPVGQAEPGGPTAVFTHLGERVVAKKSDPGRRAQGWM